jgi:hypothetical protein
MIRIIATALLLVSLTSTAHSQTWSVEVFAGGASYSGDLTKSSLVTRSIKPVFGVNVKYQIHPQFALRAGLAYGALAGDDKFTKDSLLLLRNLSFQTNIMELTLCVEAALLDPEVFPSYPYLFAGVGAFRFNPYANDKNNEKVFLRPLHTEGQGLDEYPDRKEYSLTQLCIPFGAGAKFKLTDQISISVEAGFRKIFTDHLDDVSNSYVDPTVLSTKVSPKALEMSFRGLEVGNTLYDPYPGYGNRRGNPEKDDWYYFGVIKLTWHFINPYGY